MTDNTQNPQVTDNNMESKAVQELNKMRDSEPVGPTPTTEGNKPDGENQLSDNERKAENELAELERTNALHITDDHHKEAAVKEQLEYEKGQREQREQGLNDEHPEVAQGKQVSDKQHDKFKAEADSGNKHK